MVKQFTERDSLVFSVAYSLWRAVGWPLRKRPSIDECKPRRGCGRSLGAGELPFVIHAEAVCCCEDGVPDFERLMWQRVDRDVFAYGFDLLALDGEDLRSRPGAG